MTFHQFNSTSMKLLGSHNLDSMLVRKIEIGRVGDAKLAISGLIQRSIEQAAHEAPSILVRARGQ